MSRNDESADAFVAHLAPLQRPLEVYCRRLLGGPSHVEDVLQSAVLAAYADFDRFAEGTNFRAWIFRFVTLGVMNRNRKREPAAQSDWLHDIESPADSFAPPDDLATVLIEHPEFWTEQMDDTIAAALHRLPATERAVLLLRAIGEFSYDEIRGILSIPLGSVMGYLSRARLRMRAALADYAAESGWLDRVSNEEHDR